MTYCTTTDVPEDLELGPVELPILKTDPETAGYGRCDKCTCTGYQDALTGNSYCTCGHSYGDHW